MQLVVTIDQRRAQLEQLWHNDRCSFLAEYHRVFGQPANDPTMSLMAIIGRMIDREFEAEIANTFASR